MAEMHVIVDGDVSMIASTAVDVNITGQPINVSATIGPPPSSVPLSDRLSGVAVNNADTVITIPPDRTWIGLVGLTCEQDTAAAAPSHNYILMIGDDSFPDPSTPVLSTWVAAGQNSTNTIQQVTLLGGPGGGTLELHGDATNMEAWAYGVLAP